MKIRGKNLTVQQRKTLIRRGFSEKTVDSYMMQKVKMIEVDNPKNLSRCKDKWTQWTVVHRDTGEVREIVID